MEISGSSIQVLAAGCVGVAMPFTATDAIIAGRSCIPARYRAYRLCLSCFGRHCSYTPVDSSPDSGTDRATKGFSLTPVVAHAENALRSASGRAAMGCEESNANTISLKLKAPALRVPALRGRFVDTLLNPLYRFYERRLFAQVRKRTPPRHVGLILDGNRRFGHLHGIADPAALYRLGAQKLDEVLEWCCALAIPAVTLWVCSTDNFGRPTAQVDGIMTAVEAKLTELAQDPRIHRRRVRIRAIGRLEALPLPTLAAIRSAEKITAAYDGMTLTIAVAYGGREEIADAVRDMLREADTSGATLSETISRVTPQEIGRYLYLADTPEPDLIIRTSGEVRLSGFLMWQSAYSEFYFSDVLWPVFRKLDFLRAVRSFQQRNRRFGL